MLEAEGLLRSRSRASAAPERIGLFAGFVDTRTFGSWAGAAGAASLGRTGVLHGALVDPG
jgi:hypothetical protein